MNKNSIVTLEIKQMVSKPIKTKLAVYRLMVKNREIAIVDEEFTFFINKVEDDNLKAQRFHGYVTNGDEVVAIGWLGLNAFSGKAYPKFNLFGRSGKKERIWNFMFRLVNCLGQINLPGSEKPARQGRKYTPQTVRNGHPSANWDGKQLVDLKAAALVNRPSVQTDRIYTKECWLTRGHYTHIWVGSGSERHKEPRWRSSRTHYRSPDLLVQL